MTSIINLKRNRRQKLSNLVESKESVPKLPSKLIISKIDNIFMSFDTEPLYFNRIRVFSLFAFMLYTILAISFIFILNIPTNNSYCFDIYSSEFKLCNKENTCTAKSGNQINKVLYINDNYNGTTIIDKETKTELLLINKTFKKFFFKENLLYLSNNLNSFNKFDKIEEDYFSIITITYRENYNIVNYFGLLCVYDYILTYYIIFASLGTLFGGIFLSFLADVIGRKFILYVSLVFLLIGTLGLFIYCAIIENLDLIDLSKYQNSKYTNLINFDTLPRLDEVYTEHFGLISKIYKEKYNIRMNFMSNLFLFFINITFIAAGLIGAATTTLTINLENAISNSTIFSNYFYIYAGMAFGLILNFILVTKIDNFKYFYLVMAILCFLLFTASLLIIKESPKYYYEFKKYEEITEFFEEIVTDKFFLLAKKKVQAIENQNDTKVIVDSSKINKNDENIRKFYISTDNSKIQKEMEDILHDLNKPTLKYSFIKRMLINTTFLDYCKFRQKVKENLSNPNNRVPINRSTILQYPLILSFLTFNNPRIINKVFIFYSLISATIMINYLLIGMFVHYIIFSRDESYENNLYNTPNLYFGFLILISIYIHNFIFKFLGAYFVLIISYGTLLFFSLLFNAFGGTHTLKFDRNQYFFNSVALMFSSNLNDFRVFYFIMLFFSSAASYTILLQLNKYSYTINRCTCNGIYYLIYFFIIYLTKSLAQFFNDIMLYVCVCAIVGLVTSLFLETDDDKPFINDYRVIKIEEVY